MKIYLFLSNDQCKAILANDEDEAWSLLVDAVKNDHTYQHPENIAAYHKQCTLENIKEQYNLRGSSPVNKVGLVLTAKVHQEGMTGWLEE